MKPLAIALLLALASCSNAKTVPPKQGRFTCEMHALNQFQLIYVVTDTANGREFLLTNRGGIVEVTK